MTALLQANGISKIYKSRSASSSRGIHSTSLTLHAGEILGLVGESGCGKSTLAKVLVGLEEADAGSLLVDGQSLFGKHMRPVPLGRRPIQMIFQDPYGSLNPRMRVGDLVAEGLRIQRRLPASEIRQEVQRHLQLVGLGADSLDKYPHEFSGGQRQRICIARALILRPKVLIADEAVSALDVSVQMQILNLLLDLRETLGLSIIFISHAISVVEYLCDRVAVMYAGRIVEENQTASLLDNPRHPYTAHLCAARPDAEGSTENIASAQDHAAVRWTHLTADNVIDSNNGEHAFREKPVSTFSQHALANKPAPLASESGGEGCTYAGRCPASDALCRNQEPHLERYGNAAFACFHPLAKFVETQAGVGN